MLRLLAVFARVEDRKEAAGLEGLGGRGVAELRLVLKPHLFGRNDVGRGVVVMGLSGEKKLERRRLPGVGGSCAKLSIVRSDSDERACRATGVCGSSTSNPC